ncbi:MAG: protein adenylyltransferase SelO [Gammaproteobacteria bacterium]
MTTSARRALQDIHFESTVVEALPGDPQFENVPRQVPEAAYTFVAPTAVAAPSLLAWSDDLAERLGLERPPSKGAAVDILAGNTLAPGMRPYAARYGGHQFGNWAGQLGDGRAITLGELIALDGSRQELQLKGAGPTPYSRFADGRAVLRSSLREFLCSEAMYHLGVPTTRALSLVSTGEQVVRDMFYDGHPQPEPGAIVCRVAPTFIRFGNFEIHAASDEHAILRRLVDHVIRVHYPIFDADDPATPAAWFAEICRRTAVMIAHWMRVGFVHGVMNTDNMSILGLTLDYGPYGWLEGYDPQWTPNTTDASGRRYCYGNQPQIALWNLARLAGALMPIIEDRDALQEGLELYRRTYSATWQGLLAAKLGFESIDREGDAALVDELFSLMSTVETDMPIFFRTLGEHLVDAEGRLSEARLIEQVLEPALYDAGQCSAALRARWQAWFSKWCARGEASGLEASARQQLMNAHNPCYVPRNYLAQGAIDAAAQGNLEPLEALLTVLRRPYERQPGREAYEARRPEWARHRAGCSALSCSS